MPSAPGDPAAGPGRPRYLLPAEHPWVNVRRHWTVLLRPGLRGGALLTVLYVLLLNTTGAGPLPGVLLVAMAGVLAWLAWRLAEWRHDRFLVTDKRVLLVTGLLTRRVGMMPLLKVTDMTYERSWLGRWLGYGAFVMESAGQDQALHRVDHVPYPDDVAQTMFGLLFGPPGAPPRPPEPVPAPAVDVVLEDEPVTTPATLLRLPPDAPPQTEPPAAVPDRPTGDAGGGPPDPPGSPPRTVPPGSPPSNVPPSNVPPSNVPPSNVPPSNVPPSNVVVLDAERETEPQGSLE